MATYTCAACSSAFQFTFRNPWHAHACAHCGDYIAKMLGEDRGNPGSPMGLKDATPRFNAAAYMRAAGYKSPAVVSEPAAMRLTFCSHRSCGCTYGHDNGCPSHGMTYAETPRRI